MINELYLYSFPKVLKDKPSGFTIWHLAFLILPISVLLVESMVYSIITMCTVSILYLLCFIEKDLIIRHLKMVIVFALTLALVSTEIVSIVCPNLPVMLYSFIGCIISSIIYEIVICIKIKKRCYSKSSNIDKKFFAILTIILLLIYFVNKAFLRNPNYQKIFNMVMIAMSSLAMLCVVISVQKFIVYLFTKNKIQSNGNTNS